MMNNLIEGAEFRRKIEKFQRARKLGNKALVVGKVGIGGGDSCKGIDTIL